MSLIPQIMVEEVAKMNCRVQVYCADCGSDQIRRAGKSSHGEQRYRCDDSDCSVGTFMLKYRYKAYEPGIKQRVVDMALNASGVRDTARVLKISKGTVIRTLKKSPYAGPSKSQCAA